ncbi:MAG TPA: thiamine pyrophosphate-dependent enzyme [Anaeromyxobacteraceae bacterium]|nr:thiamine pyrophosphate-dependent enzyme [Anaeromyxobacteraceae bacterium]
MPRAQPIEPAPRRRPEAVPDPDAPGRFLEELPLQRVVDEEGRVADEAALGLPEAELLRLYRWMVLERQLDERMITLQRQGRIGFYIGSIGEEATVFGTAAAMAPQDWIFPSYREHGAAFLRGMPLATFMCGLFGNAGDAARGRQMPCHESWAPGRFVSISSPIATQLPQAVGAAWAARVKGHDMVPIAYFGDGSTSANDFHTGLNFAAVNKLGVVFACRNNGWAISVPRERQTASETIAQKAFAYGMHGERVDGNDLVAVWNATRRARARAAAGEGPTLLECVTYRLEGHSTSDDPRAYRPAEVVEPWKQRDPIQRIKKLLARTGALDEAGDEALREGVRQEIMAALATAEAAAPKPPVESLFEDVYAEPLRQQREQLEELREAMRADPRVANPRHADA